MYSRYSGHVSHAKSEERRALTNFPTVCKEKRVLCYQYTLFSKTGIFIQVTTKHRGKRRFKVRLDVPVTTSVDFCGLGPSNRNMTTITIDVLPNDTLLDIFDFHRIRQLNAWRWDQLAHVCRRWRQIIFESPLRLRLHLHCINSTPIRKHLGVWPPLPLTIVYNLTRGLSPNCEDNLLAALENPDRVISLDLCFTVSDLAKLVTALQKPFPVLTKLKLTLRFGVDQLPSGFLCGSMPCLQELYLRHLPFPELPTLLLSTRGLVALYLSEIPPAGYISPQAMSACLSTLTRLTVLSIMFRLEDDDTFALPEEIEPATITPIVLPSLTSIYFRGICAYMEGLLAQIDCPRLRKIDLSYFYPSLGFQATQLSNFINRSEDHQPSLFSKTEVNIGEEISLHVIPKGPNSFNVSLSLRDFLQDFEWEVSDLLHVFSKFSQTLSNTHNLHIGFSGNRGTEMGHSEWVQLLRPFTTMKALMIYGDLAEDTALFLEEIDAEMATGLFPALEILCITKELSEFSSSSIAKSVAKFCAVRRSSGRPVTFLRNPFEFYEFTRCV